MAASYGNNVFMGPDGQMYMLTIVINADIDFDPNGNSIVLDTLHVEEFNYTSELNNLLLSGQITYVDLYGEIDKFIEQQQCTCIVTFGEMLKGQDGTVTNGSVDEKNSLMHVFIVDNIKILKRNETEIKYQIDIVSQNWYNCIANVEFTNHHKQPEPVFKILKQCMLNAGLGVDKSFDDVQTKVMLDYATKANDNLFDVVKYMMHSLYFWPVRDESIKFFCYNWFTKKYCLLDIADKDTMLGNSVALLSFFKSNVEKMIQKNPSNIGALTESKSKTDLYCTMFDKNVFTYDIKTNVLSCNANVNAKTLVNYMSNCMTDEDFVPKYHELKMVPGKQYIARNTYWNMPLNTYEDVINTMYSTGAMTLNTTGQIRRQAGCGVSLYIDRDINALTDESVDKFKEIKSKYTGFEGTWLASKVVSIVRPNDSVFRQKIALFRNFTVKSQISKAPVASS